MGKEIADSAIKIGGQVRIADLGYKVNSKQCQIFKTLELGCKEVKPKGPHSGERNINYRGGYAMKEKELNWISTHFEELEGYSGKWVAIVNDQIVATGDSVKEVMEIVKQKKMKESPLVTLVPSRDEETYVL